MRMVPIVERSTASAEKGEKHLLHHDFPRVPMWVPLQHLDHYSHFLLTNLVHNPFKNNEFSSPVEASPSTNFIP